MKYANAKTGQSLESYEKQILVHFAKSLVNEFEQEILSIREEKE